MIHHWLKRRADAHAADERGLVRMILGVGTLVIVCVVLLAVAIALTFSVSVDGRSMNPTLTTKQRLSIDFLHRKNIKRFDLVEAVEPAYGTVAGGAHIVKRVIGLPGDRIEIVGGTNPVVYLQPAGSTTTYRVENSAWPAQIGSDVSSCCSDNGSTTTNGGPAHWVTIPTSDYWLLGDNWGGSTDSRVFGFVSFNSLKARLNFRLLPLSKFGRIANPAKLVPVSTTLG